MNEEKTQKLIPLFEGYIGSKPLPRDIKKITPPYSLKMSLRIAYSTLEKKAAFPQKQLHNKKQP